MFEKFKEILFNKKISIPYRIMFKKNKFGTPYLTDVFINVEGLFLPLDIDKLRKLQPEFYENILVNLDKQGE